MVCQSNKVQSSTPDLLCRFAESTLTHYGQDEGDEKLFLTKLRTDFNWPCHFHDDSNPRFPHTVVTDEELEERLEHFFLCARALVGVVGAS